MAVPVRWRPTLLALIVAASTVPARAGPGHDTAVLGEADDWKDEANARIEQIRKRDVAVTVVDETGQGVAGVTVNIDQARHHFAFGSEIGFALVGNADYRSFFFDHFEWGVFGNETKWFFNEPYRYMETYAKADAMVDLCNQHGVLLRGHCLFWAKEQFTPPWSRSLPPEELQEEVDERIDSAVDHFRDSFLHWDVNNEMLDGHFFEDRLGPEIRPHMFQRSHEVDPDCKLFTNDYSIIAGSSSRTDRYIRQIEDLLAAGAPVHAIGVQGHFWGDTVDPLTILARLDQLSVLDLPVWVTEYDAVDSNDVERADKLENCYRAAFSHPSVEGILMWGFWGGNHWRGSDAAIVDEDWTLNAAGERYETLIAEWTTHESGATGVGGRFDYRGFHGTYQVTVDPGAGEPLVDTLEVRPGKGTARFLVPLDPGSCFAAGEVEELRLTHLRSTSTTTLTWEALPWRSDMSTLYDTLRSENPADFGNDAFCLESNDGADTEAGDTLDPAPGTVHYFLVRGEYDCRTGQGPLGENSSDVPRAGRKCGK